MRWTATIILFMLIQGAFGQRMPCNNYEECEIWILDTLKYAEDNGTVEPILRLLDYQDVNDSIKVVLILSEIQHYRLRSEDTVTCDTLVNGNLYNQIIGKILSRYEDALDSVNLYNELYVRSNRFNYIKLLVNDHRGDLNDSLRQVYREEFRWLKQYHYKLDRDGFALGVNMALAKDQWVGVEISPFETLIPRTVLRGTQNGQKAKYTLQPMPTALDILAFNYKRSLKNNINEISINLLKLSSPLYISPAEFGVDFGGAMSKPKWFYRPSIGIGWGAVSAAYAYNIYFSGRVGTPLDKHWLLCSLSYPITNYNRLRN